jgi:hypothetical protein
LHEGDRRLGGPEPSKPSPRDVKKNLKELEERRRKAIVERVEE